MVNQRGKKSSSAQRVDLPGDQPLMKPVPIRVRTISFNGLFYFLFKEKERDFLLRLRSSLQHVLLYEDLDLQRRARNIIPLVELEKKAKEASQKTKQGGEAGVDERDCLILELLSWFKGKQRVSCYLSLILESI